ncbi:MAG: cytochrome c biogenesis protein CcsA [Chloroflexia bacterium]
MSTGTFFLAAVLLAALGGMVACYRVIRGQREALSWARWLTWLAGASALLASLLLLALILFQRYDIAYVYEYTSRELSLPLRLSAFWAGQQGSFLLWLLLSAVGALLQIRRAREFEPYVLFFLLLVQAGLTLFLLVDSPFRPLGRPVSDGFGLNPLLQNVWMVLHPPALFLGYAGLAIPFAYALAGLWRRDYDGWVALALPWTLAGWFFLGLGILLGAYWAYETLGWGGYWGWDLVENSSLIPWLTGTALLHGLLIQRYRGRLRHGVFLLAAVSFLLVLYATYLTRSGVLSEISTHSFVESQLGPWMLGLLGVCAAAGLRLLASRWSDIPRSPVLAGPARGPRLVGDVEGSVGRAPRSWFSRDLTFLLTLLLLLLMAAPVWVGTLVPVMTRLRGTADALDTAFYPRTTAPTLFLLLAVLSLCPFLGWQGSEWRRLGRFLAVPALVAVLSFIAALLMGARQPLSLALIVLGAFACASNVAMIVRTLRGGVLRLGGYLAHVGVGVVVVGVVVSSAYSVDGPRLTLVEGEPREALGYRFTFVGWQESPGKHPALRLEVEQGDRRFIALPELFQNPQDGSLVATPEVRRGLAYDLYIAAEGYTPPAEAEQALLIEGEPAAVGGYTMTLRTLERLEPLVRATVDYETVEGSGMVTLTQGLSETLPGGESLFLEDTFTLLPLQKGNPLQAGPYTVTLQRFTTMHDASGGVEAGAVVSFATADGARVVTPTLQVGQDGQVNAPPLSLSSEVQVRLLHIAVEEGTAWLQVSGIDLPPWPRAVWLRLEPPPGSGGTAQVHVSLKPGMSLLWTGATLLLVGTAVAFLRRSLGLRNVRPG